MKFNKIASIVLSLLIIIPANVIADGVILEPYVDRWRPIDENSQLAAINYKDGIERMIISVNFNMEDVDEAAWIFPVPSLPNNVAIDVVDEFPRFYGQDVVEKSKSDVNNMMDAIRATQIYPLFFNRRPYYRPLYELGMFTAGREEGKDSDSGVTVHEHLEKHGITTEIITAHTGDDLYDYLGEKGLSVDQGSIPVLDDYIGKDYTFVVSWITPPEEEDKIYCTEEQRNVTTCYALYDPVCGSDGNTYSNDCVACRNPRIDWYTVGDCNQGYNWYRQPGIFISFPTDEIYFPLMPTSAYGSKVIPITVYVLDHVTPEYADAIEPYTRTRYYVQENVYIEGLVNFFGDMDLSDLRYTKIEIESPSKYFAEDLWICEDTPMKIAYANNMYNLLNTNFVSFAILILVILSAISGAFSGMLVFKDYRKFGMIGLFNIFSVIGLAVALSFTRTKKINKSLRRRLRNEGMLVITSDKRKFYFLILFSITFIVLTLLFGYLIKLPLTI